jgi:hypothetical protein
MTGGMLSRLESHAASRFHFLWIGDEPWIFDEYMSTIMNQWGPRRGRKWMNLCGRPIITERQWQTFFNGAWEYFLNILPPSRSMDTNYFVGEIIDELQDLCYPEGRNSHQRKVVF